MLTRLLVWVIITIQMAIVYFCEIILFHRPHLNKRLCHVLASNQSIVSLSMEMLKFLCARINHIEIDYHFIKECIVAQTLRVQYTPSSY